MSSQETIVKFEIPTEIIINDEEITETVENAIYNYIDVNLPYGCIEDLSTKAKEKIYNTIHIILKNRWGVLK